MVVYKYGEGYPDAYEGYLSEYLKGNLDLYKKKVAKKWDFIGIVTGKEGDGKTVLAAGVLKYLDPSFNMSRCFFDAKEFLQAIIENDEPYKAYLLDEAQAMSSRGRMQKFNRLFIEIMSKVRAKQLYVILCIPDFFELDSNLAVHRSTCLMRVYANELKRGFFEFYNWDKKKRAYYEGKKKMRSFGSISPNFRTIFTYTSFPFNEEEYNKKKMQHIKDINLDELDSGENKLKNQRDFALYLLNLKMNISQRKIAELFLERGIDLNRETVRLCADKYKVNVLGNQDSGDIGDLNSNNILGKGKDITITQQKEDENNE